MKRPACAACKNQRRKCDEDCFLAPFFPAEKTKDFEAVHKLFGIRNVIAHLQKLTPEQRSEAIISMVYEANARVRDPVYGCAVILSTLMQRFITLRADLNFVQNQIAHHRALKQQQLGEQTVVHNAGFVDFLQENNNANLLQPPNQDFTFLHENLENPQQLQESSSASNQIAYYCTRKQQQLGEQNMVHNAGFVDFLQENNNANLLQSPNQVFNFLHENLENPRQLQESSLAQETQLFGGDRQENPLTIGQPVQRPLQKHQETGFVQGSYQSHGDSTTNLSIGAGKNVFGGCQRTSLSTIFRPVPRPLQKHKISGFVQGSYEPHGDSATNLSIGASENVFGCGQRTSLSTIGRPVQRPLPKHQETGFVQGSNQSRGDSATNISIEASKNVFGGEDVEPERGKSSSSPSKEHGRKRPLDYLDLDDFDDLFRD